MHPYEWIKSYCVELSEQIRWKKAKPMIVSEVEQHLCDQRDAYIANGLEESEATQKAIEQMGDAVMIGQALDKTHRPTPQWFLIVLTGVLMLIGMWANHVIVSAESIQTMHVLPYFLAFGLFLGCYFLDFTVLGKYPKTLYAVVLAASAIGMMSASTVNGRHTWVVGSFSVAASCLSLVFPVGYALFVYGTRNKGLGGILLCAAAYLPFAVLLYLVPSFAGLVLYTVCALTVLCFAIIRGWFGVGKKLGLSVVLIPTAVAACWMAFYLAPYASSRISVFLNPGQDRFGAGYQYYFLRELLAQAALFGSGATSKPLVELEGFLNFRAHFALTYLTYHFGFVVFFCVTLFVLVFTVVGIQKALKEKSVLGSLLALSVIASFALQSAFYLIDNLGYGFVASLSMPFISYGNISLLLNAALTGFMLSVFRTGEIVRDCPLGANANCGKNNFSNVSYTDGRLVIEVYLPNWKEKVMHFLQK